MKILFWRIFILKLAFKVCLLPVLFLFSSANANAAEVYDPAAQNMNRAMSGIMQDAMVNRGYVPNDPRTYSTLSSASRYVAAGAGTAAAIAIGTISAPAWLTFTLAAAAGGLISYGVSLAADSLLRWYFKPEENKIEVERPSTPVGTGVVLQGAYWQSTILGIIGSDPMAVLQTAVAANWPEDSSSTYELGDCTTSQNPTKITCGVARVNKNTGYKQKNYAAIGANYYESGAPGSCQPGFVYRLDQGGCIAVPSQASPNAVLTPQQAVDTLTPEQLAQPLNPALVAQLTNNVWREAASLAGYDGLPYPASNPITTQEALDWMQRNPQHWPTVGDFVKPNPTTTDQQSPWALPSNPTAPVTTPTTNPNPSATNPASDNPQANLGPDPGIGSPSLEQPPTAQQIVNPILDLAPELRNFEANGQSGTCPKPTIELYGTHVLEAHCILIEDNKPIIQAAMTFAWAAIALFIILSA